VLDRHERFCLNDEKHRDREHESNWFWIVSDQSFSSTPPKSTNKYGQKTAAKMAAFVIRNGSNS
jgi:hypothetical protein